MEPWRLSPIALLLGSAMKERWIYLASNLWLPESVRGVVGRLHGNVEEKGLKEGEAENGVDYPFEGNFTALWGWDSVVCLRGLLRAS